MTRSKKVDSQLDAKIKTWLKRHDPDYVSKMTEINKTDAIKKKRNDLSRIRRAGHSATHAIFRKYSPLKDEQGNVYVWNDKYKRLLKNDCEVVRRARDGTMHYIPYETEEDLDDPKYDERIVSEIDKKLAEHVEKLFNGDEEMEKKMKKRKFVITKELTDDDLYWKRLEPGERKELLKKLKRKM